MSHIEDSFLYRSWLIMPPKTDTQVWTASKQGLIRTGQTKEDVQRQVDEYQNEQHPRPAD